MESAIKHRGRAPRAPEDPPGRHRRRHRAKTRCARSSRTSTKTRCSIARFERRLRGKTPKELDDEGPRPHRPRPRRRRVSTRSRALDLCKTPAERRLSRTYNREMHPREIRASFLKYFEKHGHRVVPSSPAAARRRPDAALHQRRDEPVQGRVPRPREARLHARRDVAEVHARQRQAQRPRQRRALAAASHVLRDARQLLVRRLLQARRDRAGVERC